MDAREPRKITIRIGARRDRERISALRHEIYARELHQHHVNVRGRLSDDLDEFNVYIVAHAGEVLGFISVTPPWGGHYSIDKHLRREECPFRFDDGLFEVRILTVPKAHRGASLAAVLMWAALRWIVTQGGRRIVVIGRSDLLGFYASVGLEPLGRRVRSGEVEFELMSADVEDMTRSVLARWGALLARVRERVDWRLEMPYFPAAWCEHGGVFFEAIGERFEDLGRRRKIINADVLDAWFPPAPAVVSALREHLPWLMQTSPPNRAAGLVAEIADARGVPAEAVAPGAGSTDLLFRALPLWLNKDSRALICDPTYGEYAHLLERIIGCQVDRFPLRRENGYQLDLDAYGEALQHEYDLAVLVNPNNPTGGWTPPEKLARRLERLSARTRCWIDETYSDFVGGGGSLESSAAASGRVFACKSMSKAYALSGMRIAYLVGPPHEVRVLLERTPPWAVSLPAQVAGVKALRCTEYYERRREQTRRLRGVLARGLRDLRGLDVVEGAANFVLVHLPEDGPTAAAVTAACRRRGLFVRDLTSVSDSFHGRAIRIAVKDAATTRRIIKLFDLALRETRKTRGSG